MRARLLRQKEFNVLEGPLLSKIFAFSVPLIITNLLQVLYSATDMVIVGMSGVEGAIGAIGTTAAMINLIINVFIGFSVGTNVVVARRIGQGDRRATQKAVHTSLILGAISGLVCTILGLFISRPVLIMLGDEGHILELATTYTQIYFLGAPFLALTNYLIAILRAKGDTKTPMIILSLSGILNVILNLFFVVCLGMDVEGVAFGTMGANIASTILLTIKLKREESWVKLEFRKLKIDKDALKSIVYDGLPAGIQGALFSLSNMIIQSSIIRVNGILSPGGSHIIDGCTAATSIESFAYTATNSVSQAAVTFTSQHFGAKKMRRIGKVMKSSYLATAIVSTCATIFIILLHPILIRMYVSADLAVDAARTKLFITIMPYFLLAFMEVGSSVVRGLGRSITSTIVSLVGSCLFRVVWIGTVFNHYMTLESIFVSYPISWGLTALIQFIVAVTVRKKYLKDPQYDH